MDTRFDPFKVLTIINFIEALKAKQFKVMNYYGYEFKLFMVKNFGQDK